MISDSPTRSSLARAHTLATTAIREASRQGVPAQSIVAVGSLRRFAPDVGDVSLLAVVDPDRQDEVLDAFASMPLATAVTTRTHSSVAIATDRGPICLYLTPPEQAGAALVWHTGSRAHTEQLRARAHARGLQFADAQLLRNGQRIEAGSERTVYTRLGLPFIAPELREGRDEIAAAERGALPNLVADLHIRGDLHMHSTWSDGRDSIETMVLASRGLGYEYIAITDHSERALCSRKLAREHIARQREEIDALRERAGGLTILHGIEVDIMKDATLDFDDAVLEQFDIVLASLHDHGGQPADLLMDRYMAAITHPLVNVITHPSNRTPALTSGYDLDYNRLFEAAAATGTAMEIDGAPGHLDMDGALARRAVAAGVTVTIDSDCHRADALRRQMRWGIGTARRGWIEPQHVLNTRDVTAVRTFVDAKRGRA